MSKMAACAAVLSVAALAGAPSAAAADGAKVDDALSCMARGIYFEARGEPAAGQMAVGRVILNRVRSGVYPDTVCGVVYQNDHLRNRCQFSFACDGKPDRIRDTDSWGEILMRAALLLATEDECSPQTASAGLIGISTHYHATYVAPRWSRVLQKTGAIGRHVFYVEDRRPRQDSAAVLPTANPARLGAKQVATAAPHRPVPLLALPPLKTAWLQ